MLPHDKDAGAKLVNHLVVGYLAARSSDSDKTVIQIMND
jgi:hypothetical protein